ncbi:MAG: imidazole glycerol phosphate synthase subunit HisH [Flavobacteriaceae bacterium]
MSREVVLVDYGVGNVQSIKFALERLGCIGVLSADHERIINASHVIFPGVGHAETAFNNLQQFGLDSLLPQLKQPVLGICLGMQLMCNHTEEGDTPGLGIFDLKVLRFTNVSKIPCVGWNSFENLKSPLFNGLELTYMYFVHSYYAPLSNQTIASVQYGLTNSAALQKDNFFGVQFHPERSGKDGEQLLKNFITL